MALMGAQAHGDEVVAMHAGAALGLLVALRRDAAAALRRPGAVGFHLVAGTIPSAAGVWAGSSNNSSSRRRPVDSGRLALGMLAGAAALLWSDRTQGMRGTADATLLDAAAIGVAQACALIPGVSRSGAALTAARRRGFTREAATALSVETGVPLLLGAAAFSTARRARVQSAPRVGDRSDSSSMVAGAAGSFAGTLASTRLLRLLHRPLWPFAAYRAGVALVLVGRSAHV